MMRVVLVAMIVAVVGLSIAMLFAASNVGPDLGEPLGTTFGVVFVGMLLAAINLFFARRSAWRRLHLVGLCAGVAAIVPADMCIWLDWFDAVTPLLGVALVGLALAGVTTALATVAIGLLLRLRLRPAWAIWLRRVTIAVLVFIAADVVAVFSLIAYFEFARRSADGNDALSVLAGAIPPTIAFIMAAMIVLGIASGMLRRIVGDQSSARVHLPFTATCPRCLTTHRLQTGGDHCPVCRLGIRVDAT